MHTLSLYRRRFIPNELIHLKEDQLLLREKNLLITRWDTLHPRKDIAGGISAYYLDQGIKVSKVFNKQHQLVYWYCDVFQLKPGPTPYDLIFEDLLLDVIVYGDGSFKVLDADELAEALEGQMITMEEAILALRRLDSLLKIIYQGDFSSLQAPVNRFDTPNPPAY